MAGVASFAVALACGACRSPAPRNQEGPGRPRVVSLHDVTTEFVFRLGQVDKLVGIAEPVDVAEAVQSAVRHVPRTGSIESLRSLAPDLVLGLRVIEEREPELVRGLRELGIQVRLWHPTELADVYTLASGVGAALGVRERGRTLSLELQGRARPTAAAVRSRPRVFVYDCCEPPFTAGRSALLSALIWRAGGQNTFADLRADWAHVSWEEVLARRPELVVINAYAAEAKADVEDKRRTLARLRGLRQVPVLVLPLYWSLGGPGALDALEKLEQGMAQVAG
jgi:iron complex transport system substrate-binding protein